MSDPTTDDLIALLAGVPDQLEAALRTAPPQASTPPQPGATTGEESWTTNEIFGHLCDAARYWGARMRRAVYEDSPRLDAFDQDMLVRLAAYYYIPAETLAQEFRLISASNVALLRGLRPEQWERVGVHSERGPITVRQMVEIEARHESDHVRMLAEGR